MEQALRYNKGKPEWTLVDFDSLEPMVRVLEFGAKKYARENWKKPMDRKKILDSAMRHMVRLMAGEEIDPESGLPHVGHLMCNAMFYSYHSRQPMNIMIIDGEEYQTNLSLWHDGNGQPKRCEPPSQFPDLGGICGQY